MAMNPLYAPTGNLGDKFDIWKANNVGDQIDGTLTFVGAPFKANSPKWKEGEPEWKKTFDSQKINIKTADGKDFTVYIAGPQFRAIGAALAEHDLNDFTEELVGWDFGLRMAGVNLSNNARQWEAKLFPPAN